MDQDHYFWLPEGGNSKIFMNVISRFCYEIAYGLKVTWPDVPTATPLPILTKEIPIDRAKWDLVNSSRQ